MNYQQQQLLESIEKRLKTTMIGSLARFEDSFGYLWEKETSNKQYFEKLWDDTRKNILNNGNNQLRLALDELQDFFYNKPIRPKFQQKYHYHFRTKHNSGGQE
jgi:murein endopeptidase